PSLAPSSSTVSVNRLTLSGGANQSGGAVFADDQELNFTDCVISGNAANSSDITFTGRGGAIYFAATSVGQLNLQRCSVVGNSANGFLLGGSGGAICFEQGGGFTIENSTLAGNAVGTIGTSVLSFTGPGTTAVIRNSTISN